MTLDATQLNALTPTQRERYLILEKLFRSKAWKVVLATLNSRAQESVQRAAFAKTWEDNRTAIGYGYAYNEMANFEEATQQEYVAMADQAMNPVEAELDVDSDGELEVATDALD